MGIVLLSHHKRGFSDEVELRHIGLQHRWRCCRERNTERHRVTDIERYIDRETERRRTRGREDKKQGGILRERQRGRDKEGGR